MFRTQLAAPRSALRLAVDPISNAIAISAANPAFPPKQLGKTLRSPDTWAAALAEGVLSDDLLWPIIHELTHHASLNTAVGISLSALAVSHTSMVGAQFDENKFGWVGKDSVRHAVVERLLRPILEGLALFTEFDAVSGNVPVATWSMQTAAMLFGKDEMYDAVVRGEDGLAPLKRKLESLRLSAPRVLKKKELLCRSMIDADGYLLGYLLIKMIWNDLVARAPIWNHSDFFLAFLNDYFFNDFHLAALLVPVPSKERGDDVETLPNYLKNRVVLLSRSFSSYAQEFLPWFHDRRQPRPRYQAHSIAVEQQLEFCWTSRTLRNLHWHTPDFLATRHIPRILVASAMVRITSCGDFEAHFDDGYPPLMGPALDSGRPVDRSATTGDGSVEAILLLPDQSRKVSRLVLCIFLDKDLVATFDPKTGKFNEPDIAQACDKMASFLALESFCQIVESERLFRDGSETQRLVDALRGEEGLNKMVELWAPFALIPDLAQPDRPESLTRFEQGGLKGALSLTDSQMRLLSRLSLTPMDPQAQSNSPISEQDAQDIAAINSESLEALGFSLLNLKGRTLLPSRI
jgi:hypothetical protein